MSNHNHEQGIFSGIENFVKNPKAKLLAAASLLALGAAGVDAQETPPPQETQDPNQRYETVFIADPSRINFRSQPDRDSTRVTNFDISTGDSIEVTLVATPEDGFHWARIWSVNDVDVQGEVYVITDAIDMTEGVLVPVGQEEVEVVAAPEAPEAPVGTDAPEIIETPAADGTIIEVTPVMQSTAEYATAHAETESFEFVKQEWLPGGELGPFSNLPPILFMQTNENVELADNIVPFSFNTEALYTLEYGGQEYQFNGVDALRLTLMQAIAVTNGEIHSAQDFENFMAGFAQGEGTLGEVTGMNWETGEREVFDFDATQPVTMIVRGLYNEADRSADLDRLGLKYTQYGVYNHYSNQQGGLVIEMWLFDRVGLDGRIQQDPRTVTWTIGHMIETGIAVIPTTADPLDGSFGIDLNGVIQPYNPEYRLGTRYARSADVFDNIDQGGQASYERFLPLFTTQVFNFDQMPIRFDDGQS
jgi:hypothetical protein